MPRFDIPGREGPVSLLIHRDYREYRFTFPYRTEDQREIQILTEHGCVVLPEPVPRVAVKEPEPIPAPDEKPKTRKGGDDQ